MQRSRFSAMTVVFLVLEGALYLSFLALDLMGRGNLTIPLKYTSLLLCLVYSLFNLWQGGDRLVSAALAFTAGADSLLLVADSHYAVGVGLFVIAQGCYLLRLQRMGVGMGLPLRLVLPAGLCAGVWVWGQANGLTLLAVFYFSQLLVNTLLAWRCDQAFALGLTLFCCCDLCVGGFQMASALPVTLYSVVSVGMWLFYLPSQVLIALSGRGREVFE